MKLVRSDSPEVARRIASTRTLAKRHLPAFPVGLLPNLAILLIALLGLAVSVQAAVWIGVPVFFAWNVWVIWRTRSPHLSWLIKACEERIYIRLFVGFGKAWRQIDMPDAIELDTSEIASISIRSTEAFIYGPKPKLVEWLMIEPSRAITNTISDQVPSFVRDMRSPEFGKPYLSERAYWASDERCFAIGWKFCRPAVRTCLQRVAKACPSVVIGPEEHSELDLNGIWHGYREEPDAQQRRMLVQAKRLGFGPECVKLLNLHRSMPFWECAPYLAKIELEEDEAGVKTMDKLDHLETSL